MLKLYYFYWRQLWKESLYRNSGNGIGDGEGNLSGRLWSAVQTLA